MEDRCASGTRRRWRSWARRRGSCWRTGTRGSSAITAETYSYTVREREITGENYRRSLSQQLIPKIAPPRLDGWGDRLRFLMKENLPGSYPYTGGVFPYRREGEDPIADVRRVRAPRSAPTGASTISRPDSRRRACRPPLTPSRSTAQIPHERPDIYGKVGNSGRLDRDARRRQEAVLGLRSVRPDDIGLDDDQRPGADHPRVLHERSDRPAGRAPPPAERPGRGRPGAARGLLRRAARARHTPASCPSTPTASVSACSASQATWSSNPTSTSGSRPRRCARFAAPSRRTSSRRTRHRTPASSPRSSR